MVFENRVLRRIFGPERDEIIWDWRKLHNEELNDLYCLFVCFPGVTTHCGCIFTAR
jgi:hypothetical protein